MATLLLDSGLVIRHLRRHQPTVQLLRGLGRMEFLSISTVTRAEVHAGMLPDERYATQKLLARFVNFPVERAIADLAGDLIARNTTPGLALPDAIIAATALTHHLTLITYNARHFVDIAGLSLYPTLQQE
jgi:hypothetical protein